VPAGALPDSTATPAPEPTPIVSSFYQTPSGVLGRLLLDPVGNTLAILVLMGMILCLVGAGLRLRAMTPTPAASVPGWLVPLLALAGLGVALYLTYVETTGDLAVCGPVGDCNAVQQSPYARLFGVIPVGMLGAVGFLGIFIAWLIQRFGAGRLADYAAVTRLGMAALGSLFMVGMTFLEPFVIGATCLWCLTAAVLISGLLWISVGPAVEALDRLESGSKDQRSPGPASGPPA
jgi:uncharacterized membrane protein